MWQFATTLSPRRPTPDLSETQRREHNRCIFYLLHVILNGMFRIISPLSIAFFCLSTLTLAQDVFYFPQVGDGRFQTIQFQTSIILVNADGATFVTLEFFDSAGEPLPLTLGDLGSDSIFVIPLAQGESISLPTPGTGALAVGYARLTVAAGGDVGGTAVFTRTHIPTGTIVYEAGVPAARDLKKFSLFVDTIGDRDTGLAMVNVDDGSGSSLADSHLVNMTLYNKQFMQIATTDVPLSRDQHLPRFIPEFFDAVPEAAEMEGSVVVTSSDDLAAVTLRTNDTPGIDFPDEVPTLTAFPVVEGGASLTSTTGVFSVLSSGNVAVVLDVAAESRPVIGAIYHLFEGEELSRQWVRGMDGPGTVSLILPAETSDGIALRVDRVEVELIFEGGEKSSRFRLDP